jgi:ribosomal protein S27E
MSVYHVNKKNINSLMIKFFKFAPEVVNGTCPTCEEQTLLVSVTRDQYRCITCGTDLQQHINGKISYIPIISSSKDIETIKGFKDG